MLIQCTPLNLDIKFTSSDVYSTAF